MAGRTYSTRGALRDPLVRNHFVYRLFDQAGALLYVGCSIRPVDRIKEHRMMSPEMVAATARVKVQGPYNYQTARQIERAAILSEDPRCNGDSPAGVRRRKDPARHSRWRELYDEARAAGLDREAAGFEVSHLMRQAEVEGRAA